MKRKHLQTIEPSIILNGPLIDCYKLFHDTQLKFDQQEQQMMPSIVVGQTTGHVADIPQSPVSEMSLDEYEEDDRSVQDSEEELFKDVGDDDERSNVDEDYSPMNGRSSSISPNPSHLSTPSSSSLTNTTSVKRKKSSKSYNQGPWTKLEHDNFMRGYNKLGHRWAMIAEQYVTTRSRRQVASHAQKYLEKLARHGRSAREIH